ncbi:MAG: hypothetical protein Ta2E_10000 [Mycoplasmoidaceae bacterium]|nr:MAG: hypothetical protein Ta2E_10000 [Mycoplasmoidaceae bacterium]
MAKKKIESPKMSGWLGVSNDIQKDVNTEVGALAKIDDYNYQLHRVQPKSWKQE